MFLVNSGVRSDKPLNRQTRLKNTHFVIVTNSHNLTSFESVPLTDYRADS